MRDTPDQFGTSVAISGDTIVVGSQPDDNITTVNGDQFNNSALESGAAYVFIRTAGVWSQQAYLKAADTMASAQFGSSVGIWDDTIVVGARHRLGDSGAAYVFERDGLGTWSQKAEFTPPGLNGALGQFGNSVAIDGETIVVGEYQEPGSATGIDGDYDGSASDAGAAFSYARENGVWTFQHYIKASNTEIRDQFGTSVAVSNECVVVGAIQEDSGATGINGDQADNTFTSAGALPACSACPLPPARRF